MSRKTPAVIQRRKRNGQEKSVHVLVMPSMPMPGLEQISTSSPLQGPQANTVGLVPPPPSPLRQPVFFPASMVAPSPAPVDGIQEDALQQQEPSHPGAAPTSARILVEEQGRVTCKMHLMNRPSFTIGRHSDCDIRVINQRISRLHAKIYQESGSWIIEDADSVNGISYKGQRVRRVVLKHGDRIYLAPDVALIYEMVVRR